MLAKLGSTSRLRVRLAVRAEMRFLLRFLNMLVLVPCLLLAVSYVISTPGKASEGEKNYQRLRDEMVANQLAGRDIWDRSVLRVMRNVPRHLFVPERMRPHAYKDHPLPIGEDQTISQPYIVALMTQLAAPKENHRALEVGTGSGYQAAVLAELVKEVYTIEIVSKLAEASSKLLASLGYSNVFTREGDGYRGWPEKAPFDLILVTAAPGRIPEPLKDQLAEGGRLVIPVGETFGVQRLILATKEKGRIVETVVTSVRFVPMTGEVQEQ